MVLYILHKFIDERGHNTFYIYQQTRKDVNFDRLARLEIINNLTIFTPFDVVFDNAFSVAAYTIVINITLSSQLVSIIQHFLPFL